ncbi:hypothetical protein [Yersinia ruckeri]|uniref:hypothetical protein n=1 Tax=Yersinia ruckeri TaxID=29486 RepID=UPI0020BEBDA1|nr:hypothetical protein [Yersinia ruckeri]EKN4689615.1 hypothetical protein [Yersinia ruckeri]MCK8586363.1 hypothetical protein [Yersinia ruckeri]MCW6615604.1 hypothetical protein [Yersinia ruckeri]
MKKKYYYFNVSFITADHRAVAVVVKHSTPRITAKRLVEAQNTLELTSESALASVCFLGRMTDKQWNEEA